MNKILFTGGGTGGHIMPIIAISRELKELNPYDNLKLHYIGPKEGSDFLLKEGFKIHTILSGKIRRYFSFMNFIDVAFNIPFGFLQSFFLLLFIRPRLVFSKGGSGSLVVCFAAKYLRIPVFLHESDSIPGLSNQKISKFARKIFISFVSATNYFEKEKTILVGNPVRKDLLDIEQSKAKELLNIVGDKKSVIFFIGGSQGAEAMNEFILVNLNKILKDYEIIHMSGQNKYKDVNSESTAMIRDDQKKYYHLYKTLNELELKSALKVADIIVSRAGSGGIFEIALFGKPSILIPLPYAAQNHQLKNAYEYAKTGASVVIEQANLIPNLFLETVENILKDQENYKMKEAALSFAKPESATTIAQNIIEFLQNK